MQITPSNYYGIAAISHSLRHFLLGKGFKMFSSLATIVMVARFLNLQEYAPYVSITGLNECAWRCRRSQAVLFRTFPSFAQPETI